MIASGGGGQDFPEGWDKDFGKKTFYFSSFFHFITLIKMCDTKHQNLKESNDSLISSFTELNSDPPFLTEIKNGRSGTFALFWNLSRDKEASCKH